MDMTSAQTGTTPSPDQTRESQVVGRFAPTPSGRMHLGNAFSCLMAWLACRAEGGRMLLRIEDLDPRARDRRAADLLMKDLDWLGLAWDEGPFFQSERAEAYDAAIARLTRLGLTYPCFCTRSELHAATAPHASDGTYVYQGTCRGLTPDEVAARLRLRPPATRLRVPDADDPTGTILFDDLVYGSQREVLARDCGDFLVRRSDRVTAYQLAVVVDDAAMGVGQVVRGRDLLGSTARQIHLQRLLGLPTPAYAHVPLLVAPDGRRLSKRERDLDLGAIRKAGVTAPRLLGMLAALVGLAERGEETSANELVGRFSYEALRCHRMDIVMGPDETGWFRL
jgi:glutamyl-tRNA synthetase